MGIYAANTEVSIEKSRAEIERILRKYYATQFVSGWDRSRAMVGFTCHGRHIRFTLTMPDPQGQKYNKQPRRGRQISPEGFKRMWEQDCRQRWRALLLAIKAKLEVVDSGIATFEDEFLAYIVLPNGQTAGTMVRPQIKTAYETGKVLPLLPLPAEA